MKCEAFFPVKLNELCGHIQIKDWQKSSLQVFNCYSMGIRLEIPYPIMHFQNGSVLT